jgi:hypothetical protein
LVLVGWMEYHTSSYELHPESFPWVLPSLAQQVDLWTIGFLPHPHKNSSTSGHLLAIFSRGVPYLHHLSHPGSEKWNRSIRTCAQDVQITRTVNNMIHRWNVSIKQSNISYIMTHGSEKNYIKIAASLSVVWAFIGADRWRGLPSAPFLDPAETPSSIL